MAWQMTKKAIAAHMALIRLERAKKNSWRVKLGLPPRVPLYDQVYQGCSDCFYKLTTCCGAYTTDGMIGQLWDKAQTKKNKGKDDSEDEEKQKLLKKKKKRKKKSTPLWKVKGTWHNQMATSLLGFTAGAIGTFAIYLFMVFQLNYSPFTSTVFTLCLGPFLTVGLAFSEELRLMAFLMFPYLFAGRGRAMLLSFCLVLAINGPGKSIIFNTEVLNDSLSCYYSVMLETICSVLRQGLTGLMNVVEMLVKLANNMLTIYKSIMKVFTQIKDAMLEIGYQLQTSFTWLQSIEGICDEKYGGPIQRCEKAFNDATSNCMAQLGLGKLNYHLCSIVDWFKGLCMFAKLIEVLCQPARGARRGSIDDARGYMYQASGKYRSFFFFGLELYSDFDMHVNMSKSFKQIRKEIFAEVVDRGGWIFFIMDGFSWSCVLYLLMVAAKAALYRYRYLTDDGYDNHYMSPLIRRIDDKREAVEKPTLLPLKIRERRKYIDPLSLNLTYAEIRELTRIAVNLLATGFQIGYLMFVDSALYFIMETIREHGSVKTNFKGKPPAQTMVEGGGVVADAIRSSFQSMPGALSSALPDVDTTKCAPYGWPPNYARYRQIAVFYMMVFVFGLLQPFMLRLRHMACDWYYPEISRKRSLWLYNSILKRRGGFISAIQRLLRRKKMVDPTMRLIPKILDQMAASISCLRVLFTYMGMRRVYCGVCAQTYDPEKDTASFKKCENFACEGVYCFECFSDMNNRCTLCLKPIDYGDLSDVSEEQDSSSDEEAIRRREERLLMKELGIPDQEEDEAEDVELEYDYQTDRNQADYWESDQEAWEQRRKSRRDVETQRDDPGATSDMADTDEQSEVEDDTDYDQSEAELTDLNQPEVEDAFYDDGQLEAEELDYGQLDPYYDEQSEWENTELV